MYHSDSFSALASFTNMESQAKGSLEGNISANTSWKALDKLEFFTQFVNTSVYNNFPNASEILHDRVLLCKPEFLSQIVIGFLGILLNLLCMMALLQVRDKWTCHFRIMLSLMFADLLTAISDVTLVLFNSLCLIFCWGNKFFRHLALQTCHLWFSYYGYECNFAESNVHGYRSLCHHYVSLA